MIQKIGSFLVFFVFALTGTVSAETIQLPKTGQIKCYDAVGTEVVCSGTGQDGDIQAGVSWPEPRFFITFCSDPGPCDGQNADCDSNSGNDVVTDNLTGLMWTRHGSLHTASWDEAIDFNGITLCGYSDWRLPNANELKSMFNASKPNTAIWLNTQGFINVSGSYWSSTTRSDYTDGAWAVDLTIGYSSALPKSNREIVWLVRSQNLSMSAPAMIPQTGQTTSYRSGDDGDLQIGIPWPVPRFDDRGEAVIDNLTGLMWTKSASAPGPGECSPVTRQYWADNFEYIKCLNVNSYLGYTDWRMPNRNEFLSLIDFSCNFPSLPLDNPFVDFFSYTPLSTSMAPFPDNAWIVRLDGVIDGYMKVNPLFCWPVRGGLVTNKPLFVNAGINLSINSNQVSTTTIHGTASDPNAGDVLTYRWLEGGTVLLASTPVGLNGDCPLSLAGLGLSIGTHKLVLEVSDGKSTASDEMKLSVGFVLIDFDELQGMPFTPLCQDSCRMSLFPL